MDLPLRFLITIPLIFLKLIPHYIFFLRFLGLQSIMFVFFTTPLLLALSPFDDLIHCTCLPSTTTIFP